MLRESLANIQPLIGVHLRSSAVKNRHHTVVIPKRKSKSLPEPPLSNPSVLLIFLCALCV